MAARPYRRFQINPLHRSGRMTICETAREIWREADKQNPDPEKLKELAAQAFDMGKRMNDRMVQLRDMIAAIGGKLD